jgi:hypothetical protein
MTYPRRANVLRAAMQVSFVGAVLAGSTLGLAAGTAHADCDPFLLSMTPQPVLSCQAPDVPPPPAEPAPLDAPAPDAPPVAVPPPAEPGPFGEVQAPPLPSP